MDATQPNVTDDTAEDHHRNEAFLKESCANMVDHMDSNEGYSQFSLANFQLVISKSEKKKRRKKLKAREAYEQDPDLTSLIAMLLGTCHSVLLRDYNLILRDHEHKDSNSLNRIKREEFKACPDLNNLIEIPTKATNLTWYNRKYGRTLIERKLDRALCNQ
ncbi:hypothetical protein KIW84_012056 [Lathyrus oleraceus]|uniref:Uncharacterized protein n=1 Tax=Pisum sativum TaxID=3888 RepID=A0A9D5BGI2_PEA|nr:hypothetical protein KIW84_012056 [Pisum sativum]